MATTTPPLSLLLTISSLPPSPSFSSQYPLSLIHKYLFGKRGYYEDEEGEEEEGKGIYV